MLGLRYMYYNKNPKGKLNIAYSKWGADCFQTHLSPCQLGMKTYSCVVVQTGFCVFYHLIHMLTKVPLREVNKEALLFIFENGFIIILFYSVYIRNYQSTVSNFICHTPGKVCPLDRPLNSNTGQCDWSETQKTCPKERRGRLNEFERFFWV